MSEALLIVAHGTRSQAGREECDVLTARVRDLRPALTVEVGYLELSPPPISETVDRLARGGVTDITAVPLVLLAAGHAKGDVPAAIARERARHPRVGFRYGAALGIHPDVLAVTAERIDAVVDEASRSATAVLLVGRGTSDPDANGDLAKVARLLWEGRPYPLVEPAFVSLAEPSVPQALERCRRLGADRIVVFSYFLFTGVLEDRIRAQAQQWAAGRPGVTVTSAGYLGPDDRLAGLLLERYDQARAGTTRVNCDACVYRVALPGFEDRVGQPQTLHFHPDDEAPTATPTSQLPAPGRLPVDPAAMAVVCTATGVEGAPQVSGRRLTLRPVARPPHKRYKYI